MSRTLSQSQLIERSIQKKYRKELWTPFTLAVKRYALIREGDRVAVCVSGDAASLLLAKLTQLIQRYSDVPFEARYFATGPEALAASEPLGLPISATAPGGAGRERLLAAARALGCGKLALGQCFNDVVETTLTAMLYDARLQGLMPKERIERAHGIELIRPLYYIHGEDIAAWVRYNALQPLGPKRPGDSRLAVRQLLASMRRDNPDIEKSVFNAIHAVCLDTFPGWKAGNEVHCFLDGYGEL